MNEIYLIPIQFTHTSLLDYLKLKVAEQTGVAVSVLDININIKPFYNADRAQYDASKILQYVENLNLPLAIVCTSIDLFIPIFTYIFGLAKLNGRVAIVSSHRLENRFYGLQEDPERLEQRVLKEVLHELGHLAGLRHCSQPNCVMASSTAADELDVKGFNYCNLCLNFLIKNAEKTGLIFEFFKI